MCQQHVISRHVSNLSKLMFSQRFELITQDAQVFNRKLTLLNGRLDRLYEDLYESYQEITADDYSHLYKYMKLLIESMKELCRDCKNSDMNNCFQLNINHLESNISAMEEIDNDFVNFKINIKKNPRYENIIHQIVS